MTIQLNQEQEQVVGDALQAGVIETADEVVQAGIQVIRQRLGDRTSKTAGNLVELFANSPFAGLCMEFERDQDLGREVELCMI